MRRLFDFARSDDGATAIEYGLIAALVALAIIGGLTALGGNLNDLFFNITQEIGAQNPATQ